MDAKIILTTVVLMLALTIGAIFLWWFLSKERVISGEKGGAKENSLGDIFEKSKKFKWWIAGIVGVLIITIMYSNFSGGDTTKVANASAPVVANTVTTNAQGSEPSSTATFFGIPAWVMLSGVIVVAGAIYGLKYSSGGSKWLTRFVVALAILGVVLFLIYGNRTTAAVAKFQTDTAAAYLDKTTETTLTTVAKPAWEKVQAGWDFLNPDGTIPKGVRSNAIPLEPWCKIRHPAGLGVTYNIYNQIIGGEWVIQKAEEKEVHSVAVSYVVLVEGVKTLTYGKFCSDS